MIVGDCTRCGTQGVKVLPVLFVRPHGHSWMSLPEKLPEPPKPERSCGNCLTDEEIERELGMVVVYVAGIIAKRAAQSRHKYERDLLPALETLRAMYTVRNNDADQSGRKAAIRAILGDEESK